MRLSTTCSAALVLFATGCGSAGNPMGSEGGPCYGNGTCDGDLSCASDLCVQVLSCTGVDCSGFGTCEVSGGTVACVCDPGYRPDALACIEDMTDPCAGQTCSGFGTCADNGGAPECNCNSGYRAEGLECLFGGHSLSGNFTITDNLTVVNGTPYTGAFDGVVGQPVTFLVGFNAESFETVDGIPNKQLRVTTGPLEVEFTGAGATAIEMVAASIEGQSFQLLLETAGGSDDARSNIVGLEAAEYFALEFRLTGVTWTLDDEGFPVLGPASGSCSFALRRFTTPFAFTDFASGDGSCALQ